MASLITWLRTLQPTLSPRWRCRQRRIKAAGSRHAHLRLESLEDRTVPSTVTWVGGTSGDWDTAANWQDTTTLVNRLPTANDNVTITTANATITHLNNTIVSIKSLTTAATDTLNWSNGTLTIATASTLSGAVNLSGGTWTGGGNLTLGGLLTWTGGIMTGTG